MKHIYFIASLLRSKFVMNGMRVGYDTPDNQPTVNRRSRLTSQQRHYSVTSARVAQEWLKYAAMAVMLFTIAVGNVWGEDITFTFSSYGWSNGTAHTSVTSSPITITANGGGNNGKYYTSDQTWRMYSGGSLTITAATGYKVTAVSSSPSQTFTVSNGSASISFTGTVKFTSITVTYSSATTTYTLKVPNGTGGYTTYNNKVKADLTEDMAVSGRSCPGDLDGSYSGWHEGSVETPAASPGTTYSHATSGAMPASGTTLYALFRQNSSPFYWHTNPLCEETCSNTVTPAAGTKTNVTTIAFDEANVETCSETASDRQVTVTITPASCYAVPSSTRLTVTGTSASYVSGPTDNGNGTYSFVYQFAQNATSTSTFAASLATKTTYTVSYNKGTYGTGENSSDTKTCGENLTLPSSAMFTRDHYTQTGWSTAAAGNTKTYNLGANYTTDAATTLYPYWEAEKFTVTWSVNGNTSTISPTTNVSYNTTVSMPTPSVPGECEGSTFMGWTTSANASYTGDIAPSPLYNGTSPTITGDITFYAVFAEED